MKAIKLTVTIKLFTPLHVGGEPGEDTNTAYILLGADERAYYPGTAFKGKVRHYVQQLQKNNCEFADESNHKCRLPKDCRCSYDSPVCRLFGLEGNARGSLFFSDFHALEEPLLDIRAGNSMDRCRRVTEDEKLFKTESAVIRELVGYVVGNASDADIALLKKSIALIQQIGGNTSRGFGWLDGDIMVSEEELDSLDSCSADVNRDVCLTNCVKVKLTPKSPLLIGTHTTQSNFRDTQCIVPGSVMRAAFARAICNQDGTDDPSTNGIKRDSQDTGFPNLRQIFSELRFSVLNTGLQPEPYPITMRKCKVNKEHIMVDVLAMLLNKALGNNETEEGCRECHGRLEKVEPYESFYRCLDNCRLTVTSTHTEMDKTRGTSQDGRLYTVRAIAPGVIDFHGTINIPDRELNMNELALLCQSPLHVGAMTTTGFGECTIEFKPLVETQDDELTSQIIKRIEEFNKLIDSDDIFVPLTLMSDAIVDLVEPETDDYTRAYASLVSPLILERVITKPRIWRGFDTSEKHVSEKPPRFLLQAGSVLVVRVDDLGAQNINELLRLERNGIGNVNETKDGYGAVRVAHDNHIKYALAAKGGQSQ